MFQSRIYRAARKMAASVSFVLVAGSSFASAKQDSIQTLTPPAMACEVRYMTGDGAALYFLDTCGTILRWEPRSGESRVINLADVPQGLQRLAVGKSRIAVLVGETQEVLVYDKAGTILNRHAYPGESRVRDIAVLGDYLAVTTWFDDHLLFLFEDSAKPPIRLIQNPQYWPEAAPRIRSEADIAVDGERFVIVDRNNFVVHVVNPESAKVERYEKERYPGMPVFEKPTGKWGDGNRDKYTGTLVAMSSTVVAGEALLVMLDRRVTDKAGYDHHYLEIASSANEASEWTRRAELKDRYRFAGSHFPVVIGGTMYLYMHKGGVVHAVPLGR